MIYLVFHITLDNVLSVFRDTGNVSCCLCLIVVTGLQYCCLNFCDLDIGFFCQPNDVLQLCLYIHHLFNSLYDFMMFLCPIFFLIIYCFNQCHVVKDSEYVWVRGGGSSSELLSH